MSEVLEHVSFHYLVFGQRWLRNYFAATGEFEVFDVRNCSDFLDDELNWSGYGKKLVPLRPCGVPRSFSTLFSNRKVKSKSSSTHGCRHGYRDSYGLAQTGE